MKRTVLSSGSVCLQSKDVHRLISEQLSHLLSEAVQGYFCDRQTVSDMVVKASITGKAIEGTCNSFENVPSGATVRSRVCNVTGGLRGRAGDPARQAFRRFARAV